MAGIMTHSPADVLRRALIQLGLGADPPAVPWPIGLAIEASTPDNVITVWDTMGRADSSASIGQDRSEMHGFQIRVRATTHPVGWTKANAIAIALDASINSLTVPIGGDVYLIISASRTGNVLAAGTEPSSSKRSIFTINGMMTVRQIETTP